MKAFSNAAAWSAFGSIAVAITTVFYTVYAHRQWVAMSGQIEVMREANDLTHQALVGSDNTLQQTLTKMQGQIDATDRLYGEAQKQTQQIKTFADNSGRQAAAAQKSADTAFDAMKAAAEQSHSDQRAFVGISEAKPLSYSVDSATRSANLTVAFTLRNYGRSTAEHVRFFAELESDPLVNNVPCDDLASKDRMGDILLPTQSRTLNYVMPLTRAQMESGWRHQNSALGAILILKVFGCIEYSDRKNEKPPHLTPFSYIVFRKDSYMTADTMQVAGEQLTLDPYGVDSGQSQ